MSTERRQPRKTAAYLHAKKNAIEYLSRACLRGKRIVLADEMLGRGMIESSNKIEVLMCVWVISRLLLRKNPQQLRKTSGSIDTVHLRLQVSFSHANPDYLIWHLEIYLATAKTSGTLRLACPSTALSRQALLLTFGEIYNHTP